MKTTRSAAIGVVFLIGCAVGGVSSRLVVPPVRAGTNPTRWEYHCLSGHSNDLVQSSNQMGAQGWEMAAGAGAGEGWDKEFVLCFKRALP